MNSSKRPDYAQSIAFYEDISKGATFNIDFF